MKNLTGYIITIARVDAGVESKKQLPFFVDQLDVEQLSQKNPEIGYFFKKFEEINKK